MVIILASSTYTWSPHPTDSTPMASPKWNLAFPGLTTVTAYTLTFIKCLMGYYNLRTFTWLTKQNWITLLTNFPGTTGHHSSHGHILVSFRDSRHMNTPGRFSLCAFMAELSQPRMAHVPPPSSHSPASLLALGPPGKGILKNRTHSREMSPCAGLELL